MTFTIAAGFYIAGFFGGIVTLALFKNEKNSELPMS